ncbi:hypothetical protein Lal_00038923 [Lupinus albus]|nr:hypothetical protein Lal_00038923 [Lupinus albus]
MNISQQVASEPIIRRLNRVLKLQVVDRSMWDPCVKNLSDESSRRRVPLMKVQANGSEREAPHFVEVDELKSI